MSVTCLLTACNSTDSLHSQGPWGPPGVQRNYPTYSRPWGNPGITAVAVRLQQAHVSLEAVPPELTTVINDPHVPPRSIDLPADPQPSFSVMLHSDSVQAAPVQEGKVASKELPLTVSSSAAPTAESPPGVFSPPKQATSYAGTWKATDSKGNSCIVHLSSVAALDLYKASTSNCRNENLRNVNTWSFAQNRVILFSRGREIAHMAGSEASLNGTDNASGLSFRMVR